MAVVDGTNDPEALDGTTGDDTINGLDGDDSLSGDEGDDTLNGGNGNDFFYGGLGTDTYDGGEGLDTIVYWYVNGRSGTFFTDDIVMDASAGTATFGGITETFTGIEVFRLGRGNDTFYGSAGNEAAYGYYGDDILNGGDGNDLLSGDAGDDTLNGGDGSDYLVGGDGTDTLNGGAGDDYVRYTYNDTYVSDIADGGDGTDTVLINVFSGSSSYVYFGASFTNFEVLEADFLVSEDPTRLLLQFDAEFFRNNAIHSVVSSDHSTEGSTFGIVVYMDDESSLDLSGIVFDANWRDYADGGFDSVTISGDETSETIIGSSVGDTIDAGSGDDVVFGGRGNDTIYAGFGRDEVYGGSGDDFLSTSLGRYEAGEVYAGGEGFDVLSFGTGFSSETIDFRTSALAGMEEFQFFLFSDLTIQFNAQQLMGSGLSSLRSLSSGTDGLLVTLDVTMDGATLFDASQIAFSAAEDGVPPLAVFAITGGDASEVMIGSSHHDEILGGAGNDLIRGGEGDDSLTGGVGSDRFDFGRLHGDDTITDFSLGEDLIVLTGFSQAELDAAFAGRTADGGDTLIALADGSTIRLAGIDMGDLTAASFQLAASEDADTIYGDGGGDFLEGLGGADELLGLGGTDYLLGGDGGDRLTGGKGTDKLLGGQGGDTFVFTAGDGADIISDFDPANDRIEFMVSDGLTGYSDLTFAQDGADTVITGAGIEISLYGTAREALHAGHFTFVGGAPAAVEDKQPVTSPVEVHDAAEALHGAAVHASADVAAGFHIDEVYDVLQDILTHEAPIGVDWHLY